MKNLFLFFVLSLVLGSCSKDELSSRDAADSSGSQAGSTASMINYKGYLYILDAQNIITMDLSDPKHPIEVSKVNIQEKGETIFAYQDKLYIGTRTQLLIYSLQDATTPSYLGRNLHFESKDPVVIQDDVAYLTTKNGAEGNSFGMVSTIDVSNPANALTMNQYQLDYPSGLAVNGKVLYVCNGRGGLTVFEIFDKFNLSLVKIISGYSVYDCIIDGNLLIAHTKNSLVFYDITDKMNPKVLSELK